MPDTPNDATLDDVLVALQKAFSRVSARSADVPAEAARALVVGKVSFEIGLKANLQADHLHVNPGGSIDLRLSGTIQQDIREVESPPAQEPTPVPTDAVPAPDGPGAARDEATGGPSTPHA